MAVAQFEAELRVFKGQFADQIKAWNARTERKVELARDLNAFFARYAAAEQQHAENLDRLYDKSLRGGSWRASARAFMRKSLAAVSAVTSGGGGGGGEDDLSPPAGEEAGAVPGAEEAAAGLPADAWGTLLDQLKRMAGARQAAASSIAAELKARTETLERTTTLAAKKCLELGTFLHSDLTRLFRELDERTHCYHTNYTAYLRSQEKYDALVQKGTSNTKKGLELRDKRNQRLVLARAARNDYLLALGHVNAYRARYCKNELSDLVDAMDYGFHTQFRSIFEKFCEFSRLSNQDSIAAIDAVDSVSAMVDALKDKSKFLNEHAGAFVDRAPFAFLAGQRESVQVIEATPDTLPDLKQRYQAAESRMYDLEVEIAETKALLLKLEGSLRRPSMRQKQKDPAVSSTETYIKSITDDTTQYTEAFQRLSMCNCQRAGLTSEMQAVAAALGAHLPPPGKFGPALQTIAPLGSDIVPVADTSEGPRLTSNRRSFIEAKKRLDEMSVAAPAPTLASMPLKEADSDDEDPPASGSVEPLPTAGTLGDAEPAATTPSDEASRLRQPPPIQPPPMLPPPAHPPPAQAPSRTTAMPPPQHAPPILAPTSAATVGPDTSNSNYGEIANGGPPPTAATRLAASASAKVKEAPAVATVPATATASTTAPSSRRPVAKRPAPQMPSAAPVAVAAPSSPHAFGLNLEASLAESGLEVPLAVSSCALFLASHMNEEGIFRIPGSSSEVAALREAFNRGDDPLAAASAAGTAVSPDPHAVAGCFKLYIRELKEHVIPISLYHAFLQLASLPQEQTRLLAARDLIQHHLPPSHARVLLYILEFLHEVGNHAERNKMSSQNLALVWGPTLMPSPVSENDHFAMMRDSPQIAFLFTFLIDHQAEILGAPQPSVPVIVGYAQALHGYTARSEQELSFAPGDLLTLTDASGEHWWMGECQGTPGLIAAAYVKLLSPEEHAALLVTLQAASASAPTTPGGRAPAPSAATPLGFAPVTPLGFVPGDSSSSPPPASEYMEVESVLPNPVSSALGDFVLPPPIDYDGPDVFPAAAAAAAGPVSPAIAGIRFDMNGAGSYGGVGEESTDDDVALVDGQVPGTFHRPPLDPALVMSRFNFPPPPPMRISSLDEPEFPPLSNLPTDASPVPPQPSHFLALPVTEPERTASFGKKTAPPVPVKPKPSTAVPPVVSDAGDSDAPPVFAPPPPPPLE